MTLLSIVIVGELRCCNGRQENTDKAKWTDQIDENDDRERPRNYWQRRVEPKACEGTIGLCLKHSVEEELDR